MRTRHYLGVILLNSTEDKIVYRFIYSLYQMTIGTIISLFIIS